MDDTLLDSVLEHLEKHPLGEVETNLLLTALGGDEALTQAVEGNIAKQPVTSVAAPAYLQSITVEGFRGIGPAATLALQPGPGLTVVCGRNGSGKSSFAEAFEVLLTGGTHRWTTRSAVWGETWRCIHSTSSAVSAELLVEGSPGPTQLRRAWKPDDKKVTDAETTVQRSGRIREGIETLGWGDALVAQRPFLSHAELEVLLADPKDLYDQLNRLLGLDDLDTGLGRLATARKGADQSSKVARQALPALQAELQSIDDERATDALRWLAGSKPDVARLQSLATGVAIGDQGPLVILEQLSRLVVPAPESVGAAVAELRAGLDALDVVRTSTIGDAAATAQLLEAALAHTALHDGGDCPVCGSPGVIDVDWRQRTQHEAVRLRQGSEKLDVAQRRVDTAVGAARLLIAPVPSSLTQADQVGLDAEPVAVAWQAWAGQVGVRSSDFRALVDHLVATHPPLHASVDRLVAGARDERERRQDRWAPLAVRIAEWCEQAVASAAAKVRLASLKTAEVWLKEAAAALRQDRLRPFVDKTVQLWGQLRQASNVDLVEVRLAGAANRSHVDFAVTVDGTTATGLGVMSQGEVNALALSVFLPRATMSDSPFRFLIIDDPVQAMDPSKVDGLARVLADTAVDRQVIVFTHDDRLPESIRRLDISARIVEVTRRQDSAIELRPAGDPSEMILRDAFAVARDANVPGVVAQRVVPALCRAAIETACIDITRRRRLGRGERQADVEVAIAEADKTMRRLALGIFDDPCSGGEVYRWLNDRVGPWASDTVRCCQAGAHEGGSGDMTLLHRNAERLVQALRKQLA